MAKMTLRAEFEKETGEKFFQILKKQCKKCAGFDDAAEVINNWMHSNGYKFQFSSALIEKTIAKGIVDEEVEKSDFFSQWSREVKERKVRQTSRAIIEEKTKKNFFDIVKSKCKKCSSIEEAVIELNVYLKTLGFEEGFLKIPTFTKTIEKALESNEISSEENCSKWIEKKSKEETLSKRSKRYVIEEKTKKNFFDIVKKQAGHCNNFEEALEYLNRYLEANAFEKDFLNVNILYSTIQKAIESNEISDGIWDTWIEEKEKNKRTRKSVEDNVPVKSDVGIKIRLHCSDCGATRDYAMGKNEFVRYGVSLKSLRCSACQKFGTFGYDFQMEGKRYHEKGQKIEKKTNS